MPEKTCPPHRFETKMDGWTKYYRCQFCGEPLDVLLSDKEIERRLNACEALSAEDAKEASIYGVEMGHRKRMKLREYARILGGDDETE